MAEESWRGPGLAGLSGAALGLCTLPNGFVIDDHYLIEDNPALRSLGQIPGFFRGAWGNAGGGAAHTQINAAYYRPLSSALQAVEYALFGLHPWGYHLISALLHGATALLATLLFQAVLGRGGRWGAAVGGLIFALHPVHTEALAAVSYQTTLLAGLLGTAALWVAARALRRERTPVGALLAVLLLSAAATLAKEEAAGLPLMIALMIAWGAGAVRLAAASGVGVAATLVARALVGVTKASGITYFGGAPPGAAPLTMLKVFGRYLALLLAPLHLCPFYDWFVIPIEIEATPAVVAGAAAVAAALGVALWARRRRPALTLGVLWIFAGLLPVAQIIPILNVAAERFLYLPSLGLCLAAAAGAAEAKGRRWLVPVLGVLLCVYAAVSVHRLREWHDDEALNLATARDFPETPMPLYNLYNLYRAAGDAVRAHAALREAAARAPELPKLRQELEELERGR